jgi:glycosyltransferase involved in cell wall biosynthesis
MEPLGQSQVLAYLKILSINWKIFLISYEKKNDWTNYYKEKQFEKELENLGIIWHPLRYHKRPTAIATSWDICCGIICSIWLVKRYSIGVVHARSYVPSVMALVLKKFLAIKFIFDMRGFWADERIDGGIWSSKGKMYKVAKWFEKQFLLNADYVVSLTNAAKRELEGFDYLKSKIPPIKVIPTCADLMLFKPKERQNDSSDFMLGYVGTVGTWYLFDEVIKCYLELKIILPKSRLIIINRNEHKYIEEKLIKAGVKHSEFEINIATHAEVPMQISKMHAGIFFIKPVYSKLASAPTKLAEFLGCGKPCLSNTGIGDMAEILESENVGIALKSFESKSMVTALKKLLLLVSDPTISQRCVDTAERHFSLDKGVEAYNEIYLKLNSK